MNATLKRTDTHRPSAINPAEYEYVCLEHIKSEGLESAIIMQRERKVFNAHRERTGAKWSEHEHGGVCMICGTRNACYTVVFHHAPSNTYIRTGFDCAAKLDYQDAEAFRTFRKGCMDALKAKAGKRKAQQILSMEGLDAAWDIYTNRDGYFTYGDDGKLTTSNGEDHELVRAKDIIREIIGKLVKWGNISVKQIDFVKSLVQKVQNWDQIKAEREAAKALIPDVPEGRLEVQGTVISTKWDEEWDVLKMVVESVEGYRVWGTVPRALSGDVKHRKVKFTGTITRSNNDSKFGFFKRPSKAEFLDNWLFIS